MGSAGHSVVLINACFYTLKLTEHKQCGKFVSHFIADFNVMYKELEQNTPTLTYIMYSQHGYLSYMCNILCSTTVFFKCCTNNLLSIPHQN